MRHIPIFTFINKMDRETKDPLDLCEEVERELGIDTYPMNWPIGCGKEFQGVYDREKSSILFFSSEGKGRKAGLVEADLQSSALDELIGSAKADALREETRMLREYASQISSEYQAQVDIQQNRVMKLLTIVTTIFLPLSLLVGWYGMNFQGMPELSWTYGYPAVIAVSVLLAVGLIVYFKRKHWF